MLTLIRAQHQIPFAEKSARGRDAHHGQHTEAHRHRTDRHFSIEPAQTEQVDFTKAVPDAPDDEEQAAFHKGVVDDMQHRTDDAVHIPQRHADRNIPQLRHRRIRQHPAKIELRQCHDRANQNTGNTHHANDVHQGLHDLAFHAEDVEEEPQHGIRRHLAHATRNQADGRRVGMRIRIRLPAVQREQRHLNAKGDEEAGHRERKQRRTRKRLNAHRNVRHVQRTRHGVHIPDAQQIERCGNGAHQQVAERGKHGFFPTHCNQAIA